MSQQRTNRNSNRNNERPRDYTAAAWGACKFYIRRPLRDMLRAMDLWEDIRQEVALVAFECERDQVSYKETCRRTHRALYRVMRAMGFRKPKAKMSFERLDQTFTEIRDLPLPVLHDHPHLLLHDHPYPLLGDGHEELEKDAVGGEEE